MSEWNGRSRVGRCLSLGAGTQSSVIALMSAHGELPSLDAAIFADTDWEPPNVYAHLAWLEGEILQAPHPFPVHHVQKDNRSLRQDALNVHNQHGTKHIVIPMRTSAGLYNRQCTSQYKIRPIEKRMKELFAPDSHSYVEQWMGISVDEAQRMKDNPKKWIRSCFPLIDRRMTRAHCQAWFRAHYPERGPLPKSSCIGCPYHTRAAWKEIRRRYPVQFAEAAQIERNIQARAARINKELIPYMHGSLRPLEQAVPDPALSASLFDDYDDGGSDECGGFCFS